MFVIISVPAAKNRMLLNAHRSSRTSDGALRQSGEYLGDIGSSISSLNANTSELEAITMHATQNAIAQMLSMPHDPALMTNRRNNYPEIHLGGVEDQNGYGANQRAPLSPQQAYMLGYPLENAPSPMSRSGSQHNNVSANYYMSGMTYPKMAPNGVALWVGSNASHQPLTPMMGVNSFMMNQNHLSPSHSIGASEARAEEDTELLKNETESPFEESNSTLDWRKNGRNSVELTDTTLHNDNDSSMASAASLPKDANKARTPNLPTRSDSLNLNGEVHN
ncbi:hypothetical protein Ciccas_010075 [Cichlidogyrus casuarinus]|uniref:Uncharacterized protein n=1 Tax=Cichlidogyrus casuarinus TaxID=1844966 RepID=A0ABD2PV62_9PLAT